MRELHELSDLVEAGFLLPEEAAVLAYAIALRSMDLAPLLVSPH